MAKYSGFWRRVAAYIVDSIVIFAFVALSAVAGAILEGTLAPKSGLAIGIFYLAAILAGLLYAPLFESSAYQATPGKIALGIKVTGLDGKRISFLRAFGRHLARFLSEFVFCLGYLIIPFTEKKQAFHDILAGTLVVKKG